MGYEELRMLLETISQSLQEENEGHEFNTNEKASLLASIPETDSEFNSKVSELSD